MDLSERARSLRDLGGLAEMAFQAEAKKKRRLTAADAGLVAEARDLDARRMVAAPPDDDQTFLRVGADKAWSAWIDQRLRAINIKRARLRAEIESQRPRLARSFGKTRALDGLIKG